jgi:type II secretion system protein L
MAQSSSPEGGGAGRGLILYTGAPEWHQHSTQVEALRERFDGIKIQLLANGPLALFAQQLPSSAPINLLQGAYAPTTSRSVGIKAWRVAAMMLGGLIALHIAGKTVELTLLKRNEHKLDVATREVLQTVPGLANSPDARKAMEAKVTAVRAATTSGLLPALEALAQAHNAVPGSVVQALSFRDGAFDLKVAAPDAASLDRMGQNLRNNGWQADLTSGSSVASGYEGRLLIHQ